MTLCYNVNKVNIIEVIDIPSVLKILPIVLEIEKETVIGNDLFYAWYSFYPHWWLYFTDQWAANITKDCDCDFNLDQMLPENVTKGYPFIKTFNVDPIFDTSNPNTFSSLLSL